MGRPGYRFPSEFHGLPIRPVAGVIGLYGDGPGSPMNRGAGSRIITADGIAARASAGAGCPDLPFPLAFGLRGSLPSTTVHPGFRGVHWGRAIITA